MVSEFKIRNEKTALRRKLKIFFNDKSKVKKLTSKQKRDRNNDIIHEIRLILARNKSDNSNEKLQLLALEFIDLVVLFKKNMSDEQKRSLAHNLAPEAMLYDEESFGFVHIPKSDFQKWWLSCIQGGLTYNSGQVLLGLICAKAIWGNGSISQIGNLLGMTRQTAKKYLDILENVGLASNENELSLNSLYIPTFDSITNDVESLKFGSSMLRNALIANEDMPGIGKSLTRKGYVYSQIQDENNPFISITDESLIIHQKILNVELLIASILSRDLFLKWLKLSHSTANRMLIEIQKRIRKKLENITALKSDKYDAHYAQINQVLPIMRSIGNRSLIIDRQALNEKISFEQFRKDQSITTFIKSQISSETESMKLQWDIDHFIQCLGTNIPGDKWRAKYSKQSIQFMPLTGQQDSENRLIELPTEWGRGDLLDICNFIRGGDHLKQLIESMKSLTSLTKFYNNTKRDEHLSLRFRPAILKYSTHANFFIGTSSQNLSKSVKAVIVAQPDHKFLFLDIGQMHFEILKTLASHDAKASETAMLEKLTLQSIADNAEVTRSVAKKVIYMGLNGASRETIMREAKLSKEQYNRLDEILEKSGPISKFINETRERGRTTGLSKKTKLGFQTPLFQREYLAPGYQVHITANEIVRLWVLSLDSANLSGYIVNLVHDELMLELPDDMNAIETSIKINDLLNQCARKLLPNLFFNLKVSVAKKWSKKEATPIFIDHLITNRSPMRPLTHARTYKSIADMKEGVRKWHTNKMQYYEHFDKNYLKDSDKRRIGDFENIFHATERWLNSFSSIIPNLDLSSYLIDTFELAMYLSLNDSALTSVARAEVNFNSNKKSLAAISEHEKLLVQAHQNSIEITKRYPQIAIGGTSIEDRLSELIEELGYAKSRIENSVDFYSPKKEHPFTKNTLIKRHLNPLQTLFEIADIVSPTDRARELSFLCRYTNFNKWDDELNNLTTIAGRAKSTNPAERLSAKKAIIQIKKLNEKYLDRIRKWFG